MLFRKFFRTMGIYKGQFISMILMVIIGVGVFTGFNIEWYSLQENTHSFFEETHMADYRILSDEGFSSDDLEKVKEIDEIENATRFINLKAEVEEKDGDTMLVVVTKDMNISGFRLMEGEPYNEESSDGIWLSDKYAQLNDVEVGDELTFTYNTLKFEGVVKGLVKSGEYAICLSDPSQMIPDMESHGFAYISPKLYEKVMGMDYYPQINAISSLSKKEFIDKVDEALNETMLILSKEENISYAGPKGEVTEGKTMASILPVIFLLVAILTMVTTMQRLVSKEKVQIGTLKALGMKNRKILFHYTLYSFFIGVIGSGIGIALGYLIANEILDPKGDMMAVYLDMPSWTLMMPGFCYVSLGLIILALTSVGFVCTKQMLKGTAADALRPYVPKRVKPLFIERFAFFHKLSFGIRWNLRDTVRHKARTVMSLLGSMSCILIVIACFGMSDTVDVLYDRYYNGVVSYNSRIFLTNNGEEIMEKYDGDGCASLSVQIEEQAVTLDIYDINKDCVKFLDEDMEIMELLDDGAYICKRIADEHNLKEGDTFIVSPYGTDDEYELKVAKIMSSFTESIALTEEYAKKVDIPFRINSVFTQTEKEDILITEDISSIQTKGGILESFELMMDVMDVMIIMLVLFAVILGVVVLYNLGIMSYTERYRELATLKVVGFKDKKISGLLIGQNTVVTFIGVILGIPVGIYALKILLDELAPEYELKLTVDFSSYIIGIFIMMIVSFGVSLMLGRKNKKIDMVEALKSAD